MIPVEPTESAFDPTCGSRDDFEIEDISAGPYAHGFGSSEGRSFAFRVRKSVLYVEVYRDNCESVVPTREDVIGTAERSVTDIDLADDRSISAVVRGAVRAVESNASHAAFTVVRAVTVRRIVERLRSIIDSAR